MIKSFDKKIITVLLLLVFLLGSLWFVEQSHQLPHFPSDTIFYLGTQKDENGQLIAFDPSTEVKYALSKKSEVVNQFILYESNKQKQIFFFSVSREDFLDAYSIEQNQELYVLDLKTGKKRKINKPIKAQFSKIYPEIVNDKIFVEAENHIYYYSLRQKKWGSLYENIPLQDIALSESAQLLVGANPLENFGFTLLPLIENESQSNPIGNYFQNFGFSPDGTRILLKQMPDQDIFSDQSYLVVFQADGTAQEILKDKGDVLQALWQDNETLLVVLRDENLTEKILSINITDLENPIEILENGAIQWINFDNDRLWIVTEGEIDDLDYDENHGVQGLLDSFIDLKTEYNIWLYKMKNDNLIKFPLQGFFPRTF